MFRGQKHLPPLDSSDGGQFRRPIFRNRVVLVRAYSIVAVIVGLYLVATAVPGLQGAFRRTPWDLNIDYLSARAYLQHYSPFTPEGAQRSGLTIVRPSPYGHPPTTAFWALPLASLDLRTAGKVLGGVTFLLILIELVTVLRLLNFPAPFATAWLALAYIAGCSFIDYHVGVGQISGLIGFLFFVAWWAARKGHQVLAGAAIGAACTLKLFPGVMVVFLVLTRRWRAVGAAIAFYLVIAAVMTARFGLSSWMTFFSVQSIIADRWMADVQNQSIHGIVSRMFEPVCVPHGPVLRKAMLISGAMSVVLLCLAARWIWQTRRYRNAFNLSFALFNTLAVVISQWVWEHYTIIYLLPVLILAAELREQWRRGDGRWATAAMMVALAGIVASWRINFQIKQHLQRAVQGGQLARHFELHVYDVLNWAPGIVLLGLVFMACWRSTRSLSAGPMWTVQRESTAAASDGTRS